MKRYWPLVLAVIFFGGLIFYRAIVIPITHDEAGTWYFYRHINVWTCFSSPSCWESANNHWLNTLLLQWSSGVFGEHQWALRLPKVIGGILYLVAAACISYRYHQSMALRLASFLLLTTHMYLLDFFSLARGYGLMVSGVLWGIYSLMRYIERFEIKWLVVGVVGLSLAVLSNFTALLPWAAISAGWLGWLVIQKKNILLFRHGVVWLISALVLGLLLRLPIKILSAAGEFNWGSENLWIMMKDFITNLLYRSDYYGGHFVLNVLWGVVLAFCVIVFAATLFKKMAFRNQFFLLVILLSFNFIVILVLQKIAGTQAPVGRKTLYMIPFIFTPLAIGLNLIQHQIKGFVVGLALSILLLFNMNFNFYWASCREWYYDAYYPELFSVILPDGSDSDSIRLGATWIFIPALVYYQATNPLPLSGLAYQKQLIVDSSMQFYYLDPRDTLGITTNGFRLEKNIGPFFLYARNVPSDTLKQNIKLE